MTSQSSSSRDPARLLVVGGSDVLHNIRSALLERAGNLNAVADLAQALLRLPHDRPEAVIVAVKSNAQAAHAIRKLRACDPNLPVVALLQESPQPPRAEPPETEPLGTESAGAEPPGADPWDEAATDDRDDRVGYVARSEIGSQLGPVVDRLLDRTRPEEPITRIEQRTDYSQGLLLLDNDREMVPAAVQHLTDRLDGFRLVNAHQRMTVAIAIEEALLNAIIHGNLEVSSILRESDDDAYMRLIDRRRRQPTFRDRRVRVSYRLSWREGQIVIRDEGPGFDVRAVPDPTDDANLTRPSGRGILLMTMFLDEVRYNDRGNEVTLVKRRPAQQVRDSRTESSLAGSNNGNGAPPTTDR